MEKLIYSSEREYEGHLRVNSCGKQWLADRDYDTVRENGRIDFSVHYIAKGRGYCEIDGKIQTVEEGSLILYFPNIRHHYSFKKEDAAVMMWSHFSGKTCEIFEKTFSLPSLIVKIKDRKQFENAFEKMIVAHYKKTEHSDMVCEGYMTVLLSLIAQSNSQSDENKATLSNENIEKILSLMHLNYNKPIDINEYAEICHVTKEHFIRIFKAYSGLPPYNYQLKIRINRAIEMLENTPMTVGECAEVVGFSDNAYFSKVFKRITGHSPSYYKK